MSGGRTLSDYDLISYLDDELDAERREEIDALLAHEPSAAARLDAWRRQDELLRAALSRIASEPIPPTLVVSQRPRTSEGADDSPIRAPIRQVRRIERIRREQREKLVALTVVSFAVGVLMTLAAAGFTQMAPRILSAPASYVFPSLAAEAEGERVARRAMEAFWTFSGDDAHPAEVTSPTEIASWLTRRVGAPVHAPDLSPLGLRLIGGRLTPGDHGAAALILYRTPSGNSVDVFIGRSAAEKTSFGYSEDHVTGVVWWMERGSSFAVVGRTDRIGLFKAARAVRAQEPGRFQTTASHPR